MTGAPPLRRTLVLCAVLFLAAAAFRFPWLGHPAQWVQDERFAATDATRYLHGETPADLHPPTAKLLHMLGVLAFGRELWALRFPSALAGSLLAPVFFLLARRVLASERTALLAASLLLSDGLYLMFSRLATTNVFAVLFQTAAAVLLLHAAADAEMKRGLLAAAGLCLGLALSTRWTTMPIAGFLLLAFAIARGRRLARRHELALAVLALGVIPVAVYAASYVPWMAQGHSPYEVAALQTRMFAAQIYGDGSEPYVSYWYSWPWLWRPPLFFYEDAPQAGVVRVILAVGNPALWWLSVPAALAAFVLGLRGRDAGALFASGGFFAAYLVWIANPRPVQYSHYFFEAVPYACLSLAWLAGRARSRWTRRLVGSYVAAAALCFLQFLPVLTAAPVPRDIFFYRVFLWIHPWRWLPTWYT